MGREYDGGYAEYTLVPASSVFPVETDLDWTTLGAIPEMFQTVWGSLTIGLAVEPGHTLLIRGGTSSIGVTTARLAKELGLTVIATTRNPNKADKLHENGVDEGFKGLAKRWIVERTFSWVGRHRRMSGDYERRVQTSETMIEVAVSRFILKRLARAP